MLPITTRILYLHGFASSPLSRKALFFAEKLGELGVPLEIPDLAAGDFENLTITGQLLLIEALASRQPVVLIGSSLGGYLATLYAARHPEVQRLVLLAPAFQFYHGFLSSIEPERLALWRQNRSVPVFHYGEKRDMPLGYQLLEDASQYEAFPDFTQPALIFHGEQDSVVPWQYSAEFAARHPNAHVELLQSGHELADVLSTIWGQSQTFLLEGHSHSG